MDLERFIDGQRAEGDFDSSGAFAVDFQKARLKRRQYSLPSPSLWVIRLMQGFAAVEAISVKVRQDRRSLTFSATLAQGLDRTRCLHELFRLPSVEDPRFGFQDAVWGALNKGYAVELDWWDGARPHTYIVNGEQIQKSSDIADLELGQLRFRVTAEKPRGLLQRLFGHADFGAEFADIAQRCFLAPFSLSLDSRPYDFENARQAAGIETRVQPALAGPRIRVPQALAHQVRYAESNLSGVVLVADEVEEKFDYLFMLVLRWTRDRQKSAAVHWVDHGSVIQTQPLRDYLSPLRLDLYLPAEGLKRDLTRLALVEHPAKLERLEHLEKLAIFSLLTTPPEGLHAESPGELEIEIRRLIEPALLRENPGKKVRKKFRDFPALLEQIEEKRRRNYETTLEKWSRRADDYDKGKQLWYARQVDEMEIIGAKSRARLIEWWEGGSSNAADTWPDQLFSHLKPYPEFPPGPKPEEPDKPELLGDLYLSWS